MAIDVGASATDREFSNNHWETLVSKANPANATGLITEIKIHSQVRLETIEVAAFFVVSGTNLSTRGYTTLADQTSEGLSTYTAPTDFTPFEIRTGDYIGIYFYSPEDPVGQIDRDNASGEDLYFKEGDSIPCTNAEFSTFGNRTISLYATGVQLGQINIGDAWKDIQNIQINVGDVWKQICDVEINIGDVWKKGVY